MQVADIRLSPEFVIDLAILKVRFGSQILHSEKALPSKRKGYDRTAKHGSNRA